MAKPDPDRAQRRVALHAHIQQHPGEWTTRRVMHHYKATGTPAPKRATARGDLKDLALRGLLIQHEHRGRRFFTINHATTRGTTA